MTASRRNADLSSESFLVQKLLSFSEPLCTIVSIPMTILNPYPTRSACP